MPMESPRSIKRSLTLLLISSTATAVSLKTGTDTIRSFMSFLLWPPRSLSSHTANSFSNFESVGVDSALECRCAQTNTSFGELAMMDYSEKTLGRCFSMICWFDVLGENLKMRNERSKRPARL
jgi:hypothetical protein